MKKFFLTIFLMTPIIAVASVLYIFAIGVNNPNKQIAHVPAVGAGAGKTGGANAIGEMLYGRTATGETREAKAAGAVEGTSAKASDAQAEPNMVKPESLPQGFIIVVEDKAKLATQDDIIALMSGGVPVETAQWTPDVAAADASNAENAGLTD